VNTQLYRGLVPFSYEPNCLSENKKISNYMENLMVTQQELAETLSDISIYKKQCEDKQCQKIIEYLKKGKFSNYFLDKDILKLKLRDENIVTIVPQSLVPYALAYYHMQTHGGGKIWRLPYKHVSIGKLWSVIVINFPECVHFFR
jgi:hypothetical protein